MGWDGGKAIRDLNWGTSLRAQRQLDARRVVLIRSESEARREETENERAASRLGKRRRTNAMEGNSDG
jgi:hypothetical protein